jgi:hypothetical protein
VLDQALKNVITDSGVEYVKKDVELYGEAIKGKSDEEVHQYASNIFEEVLKDLFTRQEEVKRSERTKKANIPGYEKERSQTLARRNARKANVSSEHSASQLLSV